MGICWPGKLKFLFFGSKPWSDSEFLIAVCFQKMKISTFLAYRLDLLQMMDNAHFASCLRNAANSVCPWNEVFEALNGKYTLP